MKSIFVFILVLLFQQIALAQLVMFDNPIAEQGTDPWVLKPKLEFITLLSRYRNMTGL